MKRKKKMVKINEIEITAGDIEEISDGGIDFLETDLYKKLLKLSEKISRGKSKKEQLIVKIVE